MVESRKQRNTLFFNNVNGQATIEYSLLLVITVILVVFAAANLFRPLQTFISNYMGTYVSCMLSSGELPAIKTDNNLRDIDPRCSFDPNFGRNTLSSNGNGSGGGFNPNSPNAQNGSSQNSTSNSGNRGANASGASRNSSGDSTNSGNGFAGSSSQRSGFGSGQKTGISDDKGDSSKVTYVSNLEPGRNETLRGSNNYRQRRHTGNGEGVIIQNLSEEDKKKIERKIQAESRVFNNSDGGGARINKKQILKPPVAARPIENKEDESFTVGNFFKYIFIIAIILLILILGGGQIFEMSKSMD